MTPSLALERLVRAGCGEQRLRWLLSLNEALWDKIPDNVSKPRLTKLADELRPLADHVQSVLQDLPESTMGLLRGNQTWITYLELPATLRGFASLLTALGELTRRASTKRDWQWATISAYVQSATGSPHDPLVAALVSPDEVFNADNLKSFRARHKPLIATLLDFFKRPAEKEAPTLQGPPRPTVVPSGPPPLPRFE
jgi:hypothetical protein